MRLVAVVDDCDIELPAQFSGLPDEKFHSAWLGGKEKRRLVINAIEASGPFPPEVGVRVESGKDYKDLLSPVSVDQVIHGLESDWPPPGSGGDAG